MVKRRVSLLGLVISKWEEAGRPRWDLARTMRETEMADEQLESQGSDPAPAFRAKRRAGDHAYEQKWVWGCHFPWLNPRP
jgi:hypothetical protein